MTEPDHIEDSAGPPDESEDVLRRLDRDGEPTAYLFQYEAT